MHHVVPCESEMEMTCSDQSSHFGFFHVQMAEMAGWVDGGMTARDAEIRDGETT